MWYYGTNCTNTNLYGLCRQDAELLKDETKGLDDTITVEKSIDLLSRATTDFLKDMSKATQKPENKA